MGVDTVKIYCPKCSQVFHPPPIRSSRSSSSISSSNNNSALLASAVGGIAGGTGMSGMATTTIQSGGADGAAFGTTFPHLFLMTFSNLVPDPLPAESVYVPRIFGFRIHKSTLQSQPQRQQQQQQQQRFLPSPTTATTTNTSNTQSVLPAAVTATALQDNQEQQEEENVRATTQSTDQLEDGKLSLTHDPKILLVKDVNDEDHDHNDDDDNNSQFNQQVGEAGILPDTETVTTVPSLLAVEDKNEVMNDSATAKRIRDANGGIPETPASIKRRRRSSTNNT